MFLTPFLPSPLLFYGICFLLGIASSLAFNLVYLCLLCLTIWLWHKHFLKGCLFALLGFLYAVGTVSTPSLPEEGVIGEGVFFPHQVTFSQTSFGSSWRVEGVLKQYDTEKMSLKNIRCVCYLPSHKKRILATHEWKIKGAVIPQERYLYRLKPSHINLDTSKRCLAEWRFQVKDHIRRHLRLLFPSPSVHAFLLSMITAEMDHHLLALHFNKTGLLHLLGISGFQFSILSFLIYKLLRLFLSRNLSLYFLLFLLTSYTVMLGYTPAIGRAFMMTALSITASLYTLQTSQLNKLGAALMCQLLIDPCSLFHLGFQFSFLCTAALILIYPSCKQLVEKVCMNRTFLEIKALSWIDRLGYSCCSLIKEIISLNLAIHAVSWPLMLYHFHKISLLGIFYNLFLPPLMSIGYMMLAATLMLSCLSQMIAAPFLKVTTAVASFVIFLAENPPQLLDWQWRISGFEGSYGLLYLGGLLALFYKRSRLFHEFL
ncbi:MAG: ComEC/Rec2 family competence protein [Candidatus Rhabdochlamydia sp.]